MGFDLGKLDVVAPSNAGSTLELRYPNGAPVLDDDAKPVTFNVLGRYSDKLRQIEKGLTAARLEASRKGVRNYSADDLEREAIQRLSVSITGWSFSHLDGQEFPFSLENARKLMTDHRFAMVRNQIEAFISDDGNFLKA